MVVVSLGKVYDRKAKFTIVNCFSSETDLLQFTIVNSTLASFYGDGGQMKDEFTIVNQPGKATFWVCKVLNLFTQSFNLSVFSQK